MSTSRTTLYRTIFAILTALVLLSCSLTSDSPEPSTDVSVDEPDVAVVADDAATGSTLVTSLTEVKTAVIQIEAQGTFVDPEFGEYSGAGRGTGFIIDPSGLAVTNNHVVTGAALLKVWISGDTGKSYNAQIIAVSECSDLALIDIEGENFPYLEWYSGPIQVGLEVYAAGFPLGDPEYTLTKGIVSKERADGESSWASVNHVIEHDATINPGNSGGPLVSVDGKVVGVNYATYAEANQYFAIGQDAAVPVIEQFKNNENVDTVGINGIAVQSDDGTLAGIWVSSIKSGSAADEAGLEAGDLITSLESLPLAADGTMSAYCDIIRTQGDENTLAVEVLRFDTQELLEGQINGRALAVVGSGPLVNNPPPDKNDSSADTPQTGDGTGYMEIYDYSDVLVLSVPEYWDDMESFDWENTWELANGTLIDFVAADLVAAPSLDDFYDWTGPGVDFSASRHWGDIGGYLQLLDGTEHWYIDDCEKDERGDYEDEAFEGAYDWWICDFVDIVVIAVRPIADPTAYLALVQINVQTEADLDALEEITATFDVINSLP
ncbi:MAG: trypsin-like peptidase domain-containing protein [Anaerolineales bacterium]|nr:trypsin-like peptidase domain-containing protein [Anaerolineales bacterium]